MTPAGRLTYRVFHPHRFSRIKSKGRRTLLNELANSYGLSCHYCNEQLTHETATLDHIWPRVLGGTNGLSNLCLACARCNSVLGDTVGKCACPRCHRATTRQAFQSLQRAWGARELLA